MKIKDVLELRGLSGTITEDARPPGEKSNKDFEREARAKSTWHKEQAFKLKGKTDAASVAAYKIHDDAWFEYSKIAQEYMYNNMTIAARMEKQLKDKLAKENMPSGGDKLRDNW